MAAAPVTAVAAVPLFASPASAATRTHWQTDEPPGTGVMHDDTGTINGPPNGPWENIAADGDS